MEVFYRIVAAVSLIGLLLSPAAAEPAADSLRFLDHPLTGKIYATKSGQLLDDAELIRRLSASRYVLIGEKHDNPTHHDLERELIERLATDRSRVVFEMLDDSRTDRLSGLKVTDSSEALKQKLDWPDRRWPWSDYGPLLEAAVRQGAAVAAGNLDRPLVGALYGGDSSALIGDARFGTIDVLSNEQRSTILDQLYASHCETVPREALDPMYVIQTARDAAMAHAMVNPPATDRTLLVAGGFHVRRDLGVPRHLEALKADHDSSVLMLVEVNPEQTSAADYSAADPHIADYVWFTPATPEIDYCASLRKG